MLEKVLRFIVLTGVFALPFVVLVVVDSFFFPFITGKNFAFRIIVEIIFVAWVLLAMLNTAYRPRITVLLSSVVAFVAIIGFATLLSENPYKSFWSNFERMEGFVTLLHLLAYTTVAGVVLTTERLWLWLWRVSIAVSAFVSIHALGQFFLTEKARLDATLGNPIYLAIYVLFHIFLILIVLARHTRTRTLAQIEYALAALIIPLHLVVLYLTATRGATLGFLIGAFVATAGIAFSLRNNKTVRTGAISVFVLLFLLVGSFWLARDTALVRDNPVLNRFATMSLSEGTVFARTLVWGMAWEGVKERPFLGWGQESFNFVFNRNYDPRMYAQEQWFDRTHNVIFDWAIAGGVLGLLAYLAMYLALLWTLYRTNTCTITQKWLIVGLLAAYGFSILTVFDNIVSYLLFFSLIAWVYAQASDVWSARERNWLPTVRGARAKTAALAAAVVLGGVLIWVTNAGAYTQNVTLLAGLSQAATAQALGARGDTEQAIPLAQAALETIKEAQALSAFGTQEVREQFSQVASNFNRASWLPEEQKRIWYTEAVEALEAQARAVPGDARPLVLLGNLHIAFSEFGAADEALLRALENSPTKPSIIIELAANNINRGDFENALRFAQEGFELEPAYTHARVVYTIALVANNRADEALALVREEPSTTVDPRIISAFIAYGEHEALREVWSVLVASRPGDLNALLALVAAYAQNGDRARAYAELDRLIGIYPELQEMASQIQSDIDQIISNAPAAAPQQ